MSDPNADLIGFEMTSPGGVRWRVVRTDPVLKDGWVELYRIVEGGRVSTSIRDKRIESAAKLRRMKK